MKTKTSFLILLIGVVTLSLGAWVYFSKADPPGMADLTQYGIIILLVAFALIVGIRRLKSERRGEPAEDELSKRIMQKSASTAYYVSLYWWLVLSYLSERWEMETGSVIGRGILGMAVIFILSWFYFRLKGMKS